MKKIYYEKRGRRYVPVAEYDSDLFHSMNKGTHLVMCYPGGSSTRYNIDPAYAPMIAASRVVEDAMSNAIYKASEMKPCQTPLTEGQRKAWQKLSKEFGDDIYTLQAESARGIAEIGVKALQSEAEKLLINPAVRLAYDHFLMVAELSKEHNNG